MVLVKNTGKLTMNHLWERQSKALGLSLIREKITISVASHFKQQPQNLLECACFIWTHLYTFVYVFLLLFLEFRSHRDRKKLLTQDFHGKIPHFQQEDPTAHCREPVQGHQKHSHEGLELFKGPKHT